MGGFVSTNTGFDSGQFCFGVLTKRDIQKWSQVTNKNDSVSDTQMLTQLADAIGSVVQPILYTKVLYVLVSDINWSLGRKNKWTLPHT